MGKTWMVVVIGYVQCEGILHIWSMLFAARKQG